LKKIYRERGTRKGRRANTRFILWDLGRKGREGEVVFLILQEKHEPNKRLPNQTGQNSNPPNTALNYG
jgi:hypothetical protein